MTTVDACAQEFQLVAQRAWSRGLVAGSGGNMSVRVPGVDRILIKPSGIANVDCRIDTLLEVDMDGRVVAGDGKPSVDLNIHLAIYAVRPDVLGIVHAHVPWATALTFLGYDELPLLTPHAKEKLGPVPVVPFAPSGSETLAVAVRSAFEPSTVKAVLLSQHGMIAVGTTLTVGEQIAEFVEETAQIAMLVRLGTGTEALSRKGIA